MAVRSSTKRANSSKGEGAKSLLVGINIVRLPNGKVVAIGTSADNTRTTVEAPFASGMPTGKRVNWREILE